ncbi:uncharacterized protein LOC129926179 [Biomphalaria glabrata]|uniref:Galectin n=1 Tax=Biomphalaria glabrata TaxID=6526 RepID=A0A9W3ABA3_BIOGL|nr:uncharacterized protein LOC129926179 [Biomphalaria glabrata]
MSSLPLPYKQNITPGTRFNSLKIEGTPKDKAEFFYVHFNWRGTDGDNDDIAASFEFCFNHRGYRNQIVCYTRNNNPYVQPQNVVVFSDNFPFRATNAFAMEINTKNCRNALKVFVNDAKILQYDIPVDISSFASVWVGGDLETLSKCEVK